MFKTSILATGGAGMVARGHPVLMGQQRRRFLSPTATSGSGTINSEPSSG
jgi:hypothetical protein